MVKHMPGPDLRHGCACDGGGCNARWRACRLADALLESGFGHCRDEFFPGKMDMGPHCLSCGFRVMVFKSADNAFMLLNNMLIPPVEFCLLFHPMADRLMYF